MKAIAGYNSETEYAALAHIVLDPKEWIEHTMGNFPPVLAAEHIANKIRACMSRWEADGRPNKTRAQREAEEEAAGQPTAEAVQLQREMRLVRLCADLAAAKQAGLALAQAQLEKDITEIEATMESAR